MVATALLGIIVVVVAQMFTNRAKLLRDVRIHGELSDIRRYVASSVALPITASLIGKTCPSGDVALYGRNFPDVPSPAIPHQSDYAPMVIIKKDGTTKIGSWHLRATCHYVADANGQNMYFDILGLRDNETTWRTLPAAFPIVYLWPAEQWSTHP